MILTMRILCHSWTISDFNTVFLVGAEVFDSQTNSSSQGSVWVWWKISARLSDSYVKVGPPSSPSFGRAAIGITHFLPVPIIFLEKHGAVKLGTSWNIDLKMSLENFHFWRFSKLSKPYFGTPILLQREAQLRPLGPWPSTTCGAPPSLQGAAMTRNHTV